MKKWLAALAATILVATGVLLPATGASAHNGKASYQIGCYTPSVPGKAGVMTKFTNDHPAVMTVTSADPAIGTKTVPAKGAFTSSIVNYEPGTYTYTYNYSWPDGFTQSETKSFTVTEAHLTGNCAPIKTIANPVWSTTPATCDATGTIVFSPGEGYTWGNYNANSGLNTATTVNSKTLFANGTRYFTIPKTFAEPKLDATKPPCADPEPETKIEYGDWVEEELNCDTKSVVSTRSVTTTTYTLVGTKWVANEPVVTTETKTRAKTDAEKYECLPTGDANGAAVIVADCGTAKVTLTNEALSTKQTTASFVIYVDGEFYGAYAVAAGESEDVDLTFPEDSGDHEVTVRTGPAQGDKLLATATVTSDCEPNLVNNNPQVTTSVVCGTATLEFSNDVELGENEYANPAEFAYTDASGETQTVTVEPNGDHVIVNVSFEEDSGSHEVIYWSPTGDRDGTTLVVETNCIPDVTEVPAGVKFVDVCGVDNDKVIVPDDTNELDYTVTDSRKDGKGKVVVTVAAKEGFALPEGSPTSWSHTFTAEACGEDGELVVTGADPLPGSLLAGAALLLGSLLLVAARRRNGAFI